MSFKANELLLIRVGQQIWRLEADGRSRELLDVPEDPGTWGHGGALCFFEV